jgi:hypothetical protein
VPLQGATDRTEPIGVIKASALVTDPSFTQFAAIGH